MTTDSSGLLSVDEFIFSRIVNSAGQKQGKYGHEWELYRSSLKLHRGSVADFQNFAPTSFLNEWMVDFVDIRGYPRVWWMRAEWIREANSTKRPGGNSRDIYKFCNKGITAAAPSIPKTKRGVHFRWVDEREQKFPLRNSVGK